MQHYGRKKLSDYIAISPGSGRTYGLLNASLPVGVLGFFYWSPLKISLSLLSHIS